ncbi:hypothetical protein BCV02_01275 [Vibrio breoganii]|uniref:Uncharacterized protein n=1 Tax=Vibrio breoganii TaxID=553239 RepID=A0ABX1U6A9_9VIBR|nr:hypothetical protein [Vibrio breoganii]NMO72894.1 hypothetical protein [Vibrio breoganii]NMR68731.1 hypothetical protein [Vibrio breoganii]PMG03941.1 hypothetical protein BCV02_01275 [Vibrio breoganii]PML90981.1 hypothetical protein BCT67_03570 [Vibrio breoganii]
MAKFRFWNNSPSLPVHIAITWGGIIQHYANDIPVGGYWEVDVPGGGWHDVQLRPGLRESRFDPKKDNVIAVAEIVIGSLAAVIAVAGVVLVPLTGGGSVVVAAGVVTATMGTVVTLTDIGFVIADRVVNPVSIAGLYGPDGYDIEVGGGDLTSDEDAATSTPIVRNIKPFVMKWKNNKTNSTGISPESLSEQWRDNSIWRISDCDTSFIDIKAGFNGHLYAVDANNNIYRKQTASSPWQCFLTHKSIVFTSLNGQDTFKDNVRVLSYTAFDHDHGIAIVTDGTQTYLCEDIPHKRTSFMVRKPEYDGATSFSVAYVKGKIKIDVVKNQDLYFDLKTPLHGSKVHDQYQSGFLNFNRDVCGTMIRISIDKTVYFGSDGINWVRLPGTPIKALALAKMHNGVYLLDTDHNLSFTSETEFCVVHLCCIKDKPCVASIAPPK